MLTKEKSHALRAKEKKLAASVVLINKLEND